MRSRGGVMIANKFFRPPLVIHVAASSGRATAAHDAIHVVVEKTLFKTI